MKYIGTLLRHDGDIPHWQGIKEEIEAQQSATSGDIQTLQSLLPIINLISTVRKNLDLYALEGITIDIILLYAIWAWNVPLLLVMILGLWWSFFQWKNHKSTSLPVISEIAEGILALIVWKKTKSLPQTISIKTL